MGDDIDTALRIAGPQDFNELMRLIHLLHDENGQHELSVEKSASVIWRGVTRQQAIVGVIGPSHDIKAVIYLEICPIYYSESVQLLELFNFVRPDSRRSDFAKRMILFAKKCADETGLDLTIGVISDTRLEAKARLYERLLPKGGVFFIYPGRKAESVVQKVA